MVQVEDEDSNIEEFTMQEEVHEEIWSNIHQKCFFLAEEAPICHSLLWESFGYNADSLARDDVLEGSYVYENDVEEYTHCREVAQIWEVIPEMKLFGAGTGESFGPARGRRHDHLNPVCISATTRQAQVQRWFYTSMQKRHQ